MEYKFVTSANRSMQAVTQDLVNRVTEDLSEGWEPLGSPVFGKDRTAWVMIQAMTRKTGEIMKEEEK